MLAMTGDAAICLRREFKAHQISRLWHVQTPILYIVTYTTPLLTR
jgi:hypothetical protein